MAVVEDELTVTVSGNGERVGDGLYKRHRVTGGKRRLEFGCVQRGTDGRNDAIDVQRMGNPRPARRHLLGGHSAEQPCGSFWLAIIQGHAGQPRNRAHHHMLVAEFLRDRDELGKQLCGQRGIAMRSREVGLLAERLGDAPRVPDLPVQDESFIDQRRRPRQITEAMQLVAQVGQDDRQPLRHPCLPGVGNGQCTCVDGAFHIDVVPGIAQLVIGPADGNWVAQRQRDGEARVRVVEGPPGSRQARERKRRRCAAPLPASGAGHPGPRPIRLLPNAATPRGTVVPTRSRRTRRATAKRSRHRQSPGTRSSPRECCRFRGHNERAMRIGPDPPCVVCHASPSRGDTPIARPALLVPHPVPRSLLQGELAHRLQQGKARLAGPSHPVHQALLDQRRKR